jgi:hypothetical protein
MPDCHKKATLVVIGCLFHELDLSIEDEIVSKEGDVIFSHAPNKVFVDISPGQKDRRRPAFEVLVKCVILKFIVVRNSIRPELVVDVIPSVAGSPPNAAWRRLHLKTRDVQILQFLMRGRRRFLLLIPGMAKEHGRGATANDANTKRFTLHG